MQAGVEVELHLWFRGGNEWFTLLTLKKQWSQSSKPRRRRRNERGLGEVCQLRGLKKGLL